MAKGGRRQYTRDSRGRFSSSGSSRQGRPPAQRVKRGTNRLTRDNAGRITSVGGEGATARGGRLRTAGGRLRATQTARLKGAGGRLRKPVGGGSGAANAAATRVSNRTKTEAGAAYRKRIKPARNAAAKMAPKDNKTSLTAPSKNLILGKTWEQIQSAQRGAGRALSGGAITGKPVKPRATQSDRRLLLKKGKKGLQKEGLYGTLDRLKTSKVQVSIKRKAVTAPKPAARPLAQNTSSSGPVGTTRQLGGGRNAKAKSRKISDAKASRIVSRVDARRPGIRKASASTRRDRNLLRTQQRATEFLLAPSRRALKRGSQIDTNESVRRAVANAKPARRRKPA